MRAFRNRTRLTSWIAAVAILLASLAPSLSHALGFAQDASWIEVCSAQGSKWIEEGAHDTQSSAPPAAHVLEHCPYCSIHVPTLGMPAAPRIAPLVIESRGEYPPAFLTSPRTPHAWVSARPRAPPQFS